VTVYPLGQVAVVPSSYPPLTVVDAVVDVVSSPSLRTQTATTVAAASGVASNSAERNPAPGTIDATPPMFTDLNPMEVNVSSLEHGEITFQGPDCGRNDTPNTPGSSVDAARGTHNATT
jgi:hypothetical protein